MMDTIIEAMTKMELGIDYYEKKEAAEIKKIAVKSEEVTKKVPSEKQSLRLSCQNSLSNRTMDVC